MKLKTGWVESQKHTLFSFISFLTSCKPVSSVLFPSRIFFLFVFWDSTLFSLHLWFPDEDFTPLATHTYSFLLTTVAQSDTVSLSDNRPLLTKRKSPLHTENMCCLKRTPYQEVRKRKKPAETLPQNTLYVIKLM